MHPLLAASGLVVGIGCLVWTVLQRRGRKPWAREWVQNETSDISFQMLGVPGIGLFFSGATVSYFGLGTPVEPLTNLFGGLAVLPGLVMGMWGMFTFEPPLWFLPKWSREPIRERREAEQARRRKRWRRRWAKWTGRSTAQRGRKPS